MVTQIPMPATTASRRTSRVRVPGRRDRERKARRTEILAAAREVFARRGYEHATLDDIARRAEFAKGTLYNYFRNKEDLFRHIVEGLLDDMEEIARAVTAAGSPAREIFREYARRMILYFRDNDDFLRIVMFELTRMQVDEKRASLRKVLARMRNNAAILGGALTPGRGRRRSGGEDPRELAQVFVALVHNRSLRRSLEPDGLLRLDADREAAFLTRLFFDGATEL